MSGPSSWFRGPEADTSGVTDEVLLNNARTLVPQHEASSCEVELNDRFLAFVVHWGCLRVVAELEALLEDAFDRLLPDDLAGNASLDVLVSVLDDASGARGDAISTTREP